jgi:hypothetical protein
MFVCLFVFGATVHHWAMASSFTRFLDHTQRRTTVGRTPLDEWSARRRDLYLTTHNTHNRQTTMSPVEFEPTISAGDRPQTYVLDCAATGTGCVAHTAWIYWLRFFRAFSSVVRQIRKYEARPATFLIFVLFYVFFAFSVSFVIVCVLNYCHRVATQLQLNISYHISYHIPYHQYGAPVWRKAIEKVSYKSKLVRVQRHKNQNSKSVPYSVTRSPLCAYRYDAH